MREGKQTGRLDFTGGQAESQEMGIVFFVCVYVWREWEPLIHHTARIWPRLRPRLVCTAGRLPEQSCPWGGAPAVASNTGQEKSPSDWAVRSGMERCVEDSRKQTCAGFMKSSGRTERGLKKKIFVLVFSLRRRWRRWRRRTLSVFSE